jgi:hypothetical protein
MKSAARQPMLTQQEQLLIVFVLALLLLGGIVREVRSHKTSAKPMELERKP